MTIAAEPVLVTEEKILHWLLVIARRADALSWGRSGSRLVDRLVWMQAENEFFAACARGSVTEA